ncbi:anti-sigma factor [Frigidibacter oleivorans]|uniref:anti-sigma factor n=1 Tax=Frigidibacter oleivorans TaxID=2487129 RepID=UPI000F8D3BAD|nr:anti-sigma factor [Frigidibacter oleivorans]
MTGAMSGTDEMDHDEALAAEYVLGTLPRTERLVAAARTRTDAGFAAQVALWEERLAPLADAYEPAAPPPDMLARIETRLWGVQAPEPVARGWRRRLRPMLIGLGLGTAFAAGVLIALLPTPGPVMLDLAAAEGDGPHFIAELEGAEGRLTLALAEGPEPSPGQDYQLWVVRPGGTPEPQGLIRDRRLAVTTGELPAGTLLAVSLEPAGGAPPGQPHGPVIASVEVTAEAAAGIAEGARSAP